MFFDKRVYLGELRTDDRGRLIFLGGRGITAPRWPGTKPTTFANNALWHDDVCDGPVRARVSIDGTSFEAIPGYVVAAPPNYAPGVFGVVTMDDVVAELFQPNSPDSAKTRFTRDIWPIFARLTGLQWVNHGFFMTHGFGSPLDADQAAVQAKLADPSEDGKAWRERVFRLFRDPTAAGAVDRLKLPYFYGNSFGEANEDARGLLAVTPRMYRHLSAWARGEFIADWTGLPATPVFDDLSPEAQVTQLERAGLFECLGGPFHPGIELTWIMRRGSLWAAPYRLKLLDEETPTQQDYGPLLTPEICLGPLGPLSASGPGALTRWLGVPWQTDEASCRSDGEYSPHTYLSMPSFWGARVPNQVLSAEAWLRATDPETPDLQRLKHLGYREDWTRDINGVDYFERIARAVDESWRLGMLLPEQTPERLRASGLPGTVWVERGRDPNYPGDNPKVALIAAIERLNSSAAAPDARGPAEPIRPPDRTYGRDEV